MTTTTTSHNDDLNIPQQQKKPQQSRISFLEGHSSTRGIISNENIGTILLEAAVNGSPHNETELEALIQARV